MKESHLFQSLKSLKRVVLIIFLGILLYNNAIKAQTYVSFQQSEYTVAENTYLDICLEVKGDWSFADTVGFYMYIEKTYSSGDHFPTVNKELVFIDDTIKCFTYHVGKDTKREDESYKFKLVNYEHQEDIIFSPIEEIDINVRDIPDAKSLPPRGLFFAGVASTGAPDNVNAFYLGNTVPIEPGTSFSIVNGTFSPGPGGGSWVDPNNMFSTIYVIYVGDQVIEEGNNFCIFITDINPMDVGSGFNISVNGIDQTQDFIINSGGTPNDIKFSSGKSNTYYLSQGTWYESGGSYHLQGNILDGIAIGASNEDMQTQGIPSGLGGGMTGLGGVTDIDGSFYAILVCDGLIYVCDITEYILNPVNWESYIGDDGQVDLQALCDDLCGYATDCDGDLEINENDCVLSMTSELPCDEPLTYQWMHLNSTGEWEIVLEGLIVGGIVPDYIATQNGPYQLKIECEGGCSLKSNPEIATSCENCIAKVKIKPDECHLVVELTNCNGNPTFQWYVWEENDWVEISGETGDEYDPTEPGWYRVEVVGCDNCDMLHDEHKYNDKAIITMEKSKADIELKSFRYCAYWDTCFNITVNNHNLVTETEYFKFPYARFAPSGVQNVDSLIAHLNNWLEGNNYYGHAYRAGGKPMCIYINCTDREFQTLDLLYQGDYYQDEWELIDSKECPDVYEYILRASAPCTPKSYLWNTGETTETILYDPGWGTYKVTVTCENECIYTGEKHFYVLSGLVENNNDRDNKSFEAVREFDKHNAGQTLYDFEVYPVPTDNWVKIEANIQEEGNYEFEITTLLGSKAKLIKQRLKKGRNIFDINTSDFPSGVYMIRVKDHLEYGVKKMVISR